MTDNNFIRSYLYVYSVTETLVWRWINNLTPVSSRENDQQWGVGRRPSPRAGQQAGRTGTVWSLTKIMCRFILYTADPGEITQDSTECFFINLWAPLMNTMHRTENELPLQHTEIINAIIAVQIGKRPGQMATHLNLLTHFLINCILLCVMILRPVDHCHKHWLKHQSPSCLSQVKITEKVVHIDPSLS